MERNSGCRFTWIEMGQLQMEQLEQLEQLYEMINLFSIIAFRKSQCCKSDCNVVSLLKEI